VWLIRCCVCVRSSHTGWVMAHRLDVAGSRELVARWCALAEQRLQYLTEMFESGRWRRYHSERAFLENIKEAKRAVETWRCLPAPGPTERSSSAAQSQSVPIESPARGSVKQRPVPVAPDPFEIPAAAPTAFASSDDVRAVVLALEEVLDHSDAPLDI